MKERIRLGISACLLGEKVRYDGGHKLDRFLTCTLGQYVEYVPVCPEVECGLSIHREALRLVGDPDSPRLLTSTSKKDITRQMIAWAHKRLSELESEGLCGFIFKSDSPSSGMEKVKVYNEKGIGVKRGVGIFARAFIEHFPLLPVEEDGRLHDPKIRENFIERIFTLHRWREAVFKKKTRATLVDFHTKHKLLLLSHGHKHYQIMGKLVAHANEMPQNELYQQYEGLLIKALKLKATARKGANVLQYVMGYFKKYLSSEDKQELLEVIDQYRKGYTPFVVPLTLINHHARKYHLSYLREQYYLNPHPLELQLRNHV